MSNQAANNGSLQTTRQMLDELDALMEKMLALPVQDGEAPASVKTAPAAPALTASLTMLPTPVQRIVPPMVEAPPHLAVNPPHLPPPVVPLTNEVTPPSLLPQVEALLASVPAEAPPASAVWIVAPLLWINEAFDAGTEMLGEAGGHLRTPLGRWLLGFVGLLLLAGSVGWLCKDWLGWQW